MKRWWWNIRHIFNRYVMLKVFMLHSATCSSLCAIPWRAEWVTVKAFTFYYTVGLCFFLLKSCKDIQLHIYRDVVFLIYQNSLPLFSEICLWDQMWLVIYEGPEFEWRVVILTGDWRLVLFPLPLRFDRIWNKAEMD